MSVVESVNHFPSSFEHLEKLRSSTLRCAMLEVEDCKVLAWNRHCSCNTLTFFDAVFFGSLIALVLVLSSHTLYAFLVVVLVWEALG